MSAILQTGGSDAELVLVHGRGFKPRRGELLGIWREAMRHGLERDRADLAESFRRLSVQMAYYGDLTGAFLGENGESYDEQLDIADRHNALASLKSIAKPKQFKMARYDKLPGKSALKEFAADVSSGVVGMLGLTDRLVARLSRDVAEYWRRGSEYRDAVQDRVRQAIAGAMGSGRRVILVSHGSGCIVAWDVLWQLSRAEGVEDRLREGKIDAWITLGCPLGDEAVKKRLDGAKEKGLARYPSNVVSWHNVSAEDDYLCHDENLADDYRAMMEGKLVSAIRDYRIYNLAVRYGKSNPHSSVGYLVHPRLAQILGDCLLR